MQNLKQLYKQIQLLNYYKLYKAQSFFIENRNTDTI